MESFAEHSQNIISREDFTNVASGLLAKAADHEVTIEDTVVAGESLLQGLRDIEDGTLKVEPPLSSEQITSYRDQAQLIVGLGQKSVKALQAASERRGLFKRRQPEESRAAQSTPEPRPAYSGSGSDAKR